MTHWRKAIPGGDETEKRRNLATTLQDISEDLLKQMSTLLEEAGLDGLEVTGFTVAPRDDNARFFLDTPCPTICVTRPNGDIDCFPNCG